MKFLTIRQPWASLIAVGAKTIETRSWSTSYRGPLALHAGMAKPTVSSIGSFTDVTGEPIAEGHERALLDCTKWPAPGGVYDKAAAVVPLPLGAVVAVADLVDVVPIVDGSMSTPDDSIYHCIDGRMERQRVIGDPFVRSNVLHYDLTDQLPFGDFTPGRFAWLLDNVRAVDPIPMKGAQGLRDLPADIATQIKAAP